MQNSVIKSQNGLVSLPASTVKKLENITYEYYNDIGFNSFQDIVTKAKTLIKMKHIVNHHPDPVKAIGGVFVKSLDRVERFTGVKRWIDADGVQFFMQYVLRNYSELTLGDIQLFCNQIIEGRYGQAYENIPVQKLIMWIDEYAKNRLDNIHDAKRALDFEAEKINQADIDPDGLRRMGGQFGKVFKKHLKKEAEKQPAYLRIDEYIQRNNLDGVKFMEDLKANFINDMEEMISNGDYKDFGSYDQIPEAIQIAYFRQYKKLFLIEENNKLK